MGKSTHRIPNAARRRYVFHCRRARHASRILRLRQIAAQSPSSFSDAVQGNRFSCNSRSMSGRSPTARWPTRLSVPPHTASIHLTGGIKSKTGRPQRQENRLRPQTEPVFFLTRSAKAGRRGAWKRRAAYRKAAKFFVGAVHLAAYGSYSSLGAFLRAPSAQQKEDGHADNNHDGRRHHRPKGRSRPAPPSGFPPPADESAGGADSAPLSSSSGSVRTTIRVYTVMLPS